MTNTETSDWRPFCLLTMFGEIDKNLWGSKWSQKFQTKKNSMKKKNNEKKGDHQIWTKVFTEIQCFQTICDKSFSDGKSRSCFSHTWSSLKDNERGFCITYLISLKITGSFDDKGLSSIQRAGLNAFNR